MCFFLEVPRIEELQDSNSTPRREEVGRHTLGAIGGFLLSFFYRASFRLFTQQFRGFFQSSLSGVKSPKKVRKIGKHREKSAWRGAYSEGPTGLVISQLLEPSALGSLLRPSPHFPRRDGIEGRRNGPC